MIKDFTIFGERNSGTNYLRKVIQENVRLPFTQRYGFKHWFIKGCPFRGRENWTTDQECLVSVAGADETLFIFTVRNPYDWAAAMYKIPRHIQESDRSSLFNFVRYKYIAYLMNRPPDHGDYSPSPWFLDPQYKNYFIEESENLIELRNAKNDHFYNLRNLVKNFCIIRQENLLEDLNDMVQEFKVPVRQLPLQLNGYLSPTKYIIDNDVKRFIYQTLRNEIDRIFYGRANGPA